MNNPALNGEDVSRDIDLVNYVTDDESPDAKLPLHSTVVHGRLNAVYENESAGLSYVQYGQVHDRG